MWSGHDALHALDEPWRRGLVLVLGQEALLDDAETSVRLLEASREGCARLRVG